MTWKQRYWDRYCCWSVASSAVCCQVWWVDGDLHPSVWRLRSDWPAQPNSSQSSRGYYSHMEQLCSLLPHSRFPSLLGELWWRRKMRFELSPLSLSVSVQALLCEERGSTLEFSSQAQLTVSHSEGCSMCVCVRVCALMRCEVWTGPELIQYIWNRVFWGLGLETQQLVNRWIELLNDRQHSRYIIMIIWANCVIVVQNVELFSLTG